DDRGGDVLTGYESLAGRFDQVRTALGVALYALSPLVLWLGFWWFGRGAAAGADDVGEHAPVALVHLDAHRDGPVPGEHVQQGPEGAARPCFVFGLWDVGAVDGDVQDAGLGDGDDRVRQHNRRLL